MLPDPRAYPPAASHPLLAQPPEALTRALRDLAAAGRDREIAAVLGGASSSAEYRRVWRALCAALEKPPPGAALEAQVFAMPWVIVCGGSAATRLDCVLRDVGELARVFERHAVFGASRDVGFASALCAGEMLEALAPSAVLRGWTEPRVRGMPPAPISVERGVEAVHARYLLGAAVIPAHAPSVVETGANVGAWGTQALRAMAAQLAHPQVQVLPMPRPPGGLYSAPYAGRRAALEAAFNLFMSNGVRRFRLAVGDPSVTLSAHDDAELRVTLWTALDDTMVEGFRWPLHPADELGEIEHTMTALFAECRLDAPEVRAEVLPALTRTGAVLFPAGLSA